MNGKKILALLLSVIITIMVMPIQARADTVYIVTLKAGNGEGDDIVFSSDSGNIADNWRSAANCQFYRCGNNMGFKLDFKYCPDSFNAPEGHVFDSWEGNAQYNDNISQETTFTAKWKEDFTPSLGPIDGIPKCSSGEDFYLNGIRWHVIGADESKWLAISANLLSDTDSLTMLWSDAMDYCNTVYSGFSDAEKKSLLKISKDDEKYNYNDVDYDGKKYDVDEYASSLNESSVFLLSMPEANWYFNDDDARVCDIYGWWLRSRRYQEDSDSSAGAVYERGELSNFNVDVAYACGCRPALVLNLESVILTSAAEGGKSSAAEGSGFGSFSDGKTGAKKMTLLDSSRNGFTANVGVSDSVTVTLSDVINISYTGAKTGYGEYVSAMLCDSDGDIIGYASITPESNGTGTWEMTLPELEEGTYVLNVFSEQQNEDYMTDYASPMIPITLTIDGASDSAVFLPSEPSTAYVTPTPTTKPDSGTSIPNTGEAASPYIGIALLCFALAGVGIGAIIIAGRKKNG